MVAYLRVEADGWLRNSRGAISGNKDVGSGLQIEAKSLTKDE